ncbi:uncharacterized protein METZ01_LOCUS268840 [marine metagenome]|uniref:Uncharacterized protein n=1 Tax=marine metagenome TaxID=408172 RepID=A0A382JW79_9ZZZZ
MLSNQYFTTYFYVGDNYPILVETSSKF